MTTCGRILELAKVCFRRDLKYQHRLTELVGLQAQCRVFSHNFNPQRLRLGNKVLRQRLRGPALASWYPRKTVSFRDLQDVYNPVGLKAFDEAEDDREEAIQM